MKKFTINEVKIIVNNLGFELISQEYKKAQQKLTLKDKEGYLYLVSLWGLKRNLPLKFDKSNPYTIYNIKLWVQLNNKPFKLNSNEYDGTHKKLQWQCLKEECGEIFKTSWHDIFADKGCGFCDGKQVGLSNCLATKRPDLASEWHPSLNGDLTPFDVTSGNSTIEIWWQCLENPKHIWEAKICDRVNNGCPYCSGFYPSEGYNLLIINPKLCEEWDYIKNDKKPEEYTPGSGQYVWWKCNKCDHEWETQISNRNGNNSGCPECIKDSKGEIKIGEIVNKYNIYSTPQFTIKGCKDKKSLPFDRAIFKNKEKNVLLFLIEYDGKHHFQPVNFGGISDERALENFIITQKHDEIKTNYCIENYIPLLRIPYWEFKNIENILINYLENINKIAV